MLVRSEVILPALLILSFIPVWRSGLKTNLTFWEFVKNHTIWGDPVEYVPGEPYDEIMNGGVL